MDMEYMVDGNDDDSLPTHSVGNIHARACMHTQFIGTYPDRLQTRLKWEKRSI